MLTPLARRALARQRHKAELSRAWLSPPRAPWGSSMQPQWPQTFAAEPILGPVETVTRPAEINPAKGSGPVTAEEIEAFRARERAAFKERLMAQWMWNIAHL
jgi:hypothetical protein